MITTKDYSEKHEQLRLANVSARAFNPAWEGDEPCWDIELTNGEVHKRVTSTMIRQATQKVLDYPFCYMDIVREMNIQAYNLLHVR